MDSTNNTPAVSPSYHYKNEEEMLSDLNKHFRVSPIEKHKEYSINSLTTRVFHEQLKNYHRRRISDRVSVKIRDKIIKTLQSHYGEWMNIYDFNALEGAFKTNFDTSYKTEFGRLYGNWPSTLLDHLFYTAHSFEQFKLRTDERQFGLFSLAFRRVRNTTPNASDVLRFLIMNIPEYCETDKFIYGNAGCGVVVWEKFSGGILITKTFLGPKMDYPREGWFHTSASGFFLDRTCVGETFRKEKEVRKSVSGPAFIDFGDFPYENFEKMLLLQKKYPEIDF